MCRDNYKYAIRWLISLKGVILWLYDAFIITLFVWATQRVNLWLNQWHYFVVGLLFAQTMQDLGSV